jgi:aspartyl protease family protein
MRLRCLLGALGVAACALAHAQTVTLSGIMGSKALVIVDGNPPKLVAPGESFKGVKVISAQSDQAVLEISGKQMSLRVGDAPASVGGGGGGSSGGQRIALTAASGGHFFTSGQINGNTVQFMVDTGATAVSIGMADANRMGIDFKAGQMVGMSTANGVVPAWRIKLNSVRIGDVVVREVDAIVSPASMPYVLLGNSFLSHFQMNRTNDQMVLDKRF